MDKSHSGGASPVPLSSSPAQKSSATPEPVAAAEWASVGDHQQTEPSSAKPSRVTEAHDSDKTPLNIYAQAATSTISEWFGTFTHCCCVSAVHGWCIVSWSA